MNDNEVTRYQMYCQFKAEIRGSSDHLIIGIDVGKDKHHAFLGTATGKTLLKRLVFSNDQAGFQKLISHVEPIQAQHGLTKTVFGLEPTGNYHKPLGDWLISRNHLLVLVAGKAVKDNRELLDGRWDKNDIKDSANVADLESQGKCLFYEYPEKGIAQLRDLLSLRKRLKKEEHSFKMRMRNGLLTKYFPEMDRHVIVRNHGSEKIFEETLAFIKKQERH